MKLEICLNKLLEPKASKRIGNGPLGSSEIKDHAFFSDINWTKLYSKEIEPPFKPVIQSEDDISHIDSIFTNELPQETMVVSKLNHKEKEDNHYEKFTFQRNDLTSKMSTSGHFGKDH